MPEDDRPPKETGSGPTSLEFVCDCGNAWSAPAHWVVDRIVLDDPEREHCSRCAAEGSIKR